MLSGLIDEEELELVAQKTAKASPLLMIATIQHFHRKSTSRPHVGDDSTLSTELPSLSVARHKVFDQ